MFVAVTCNAMTFTHIRPPSTSWLTVVMTTRHHDVRRHKERLRLSPTLLVSGMKETVAWWREQEGSKR